MRYIEVSDSISLESALKQVDGHGHIHLASGEYSRPILITRPVNLTGSPLSKISGNLTVRMGVKTVSLEGISFEGSRLTIDSARDISIKNCRFNFTDTAIKLSGVNISVTGCDFVQVNSPSPYTVIVVSGCSDLDISSNTHVKQEASLHTFIRLLPNIYSGTIHIHSNDVNVGNGSPGHFTHISLTKCGMRKVRFSLADNIIATNQEASGGFLVIDSKNVNIFSEILDYENPGEISRNRIEYPYQGWVFLDVIGEPIPQKNYFMVDNNQYTGTYILKPLCHLVNDTLMLSSGLERDVAKWEHVVSSKYAVHTKESPVGESFVTIIGAVGFAVIIVILTILYTRSLKK